MAGPYFAERNWKENIRWIKKILDKDPNHLWAYGQLSSRYSYLGRTDSVIYYLKKITDLDSTSSGIYQRAMILWLSGKLKEARDIFNKVVAYSDKLLRSGINIDWNASILASIFSLEGDQKKAMEYFKMISITTRSEIWFIIEMELNPNFQNIRYDEEFQEILDASKSSWQKEHDKIRIWLEENNLLKL